MGGEELKLPGRIFLNNSPDTKIKMHKFRLTSAIDNISTKIYEGGFGVWNEWITIGRCLNSPLIRMRAHSDLFYSSKMSALLPHFMYAISY